jgi:(E)-4-hydroxy-3-methylbut-2-enyl-diphosphate synthase
MQVEMNRRVARQVRVGIVLIGGDAPVAVQSMTCTRTSDSEATIAQIKELEEAGCEIVRVAVPDTDAVDVLPVIKQAIRIPLVADIHFDYKLAVAAVEKGVDKIRINPGNIGSDERVRMVLDAAGANDVPIRIGVNAGSLEKSRIEEYGGVTADALVASAMNHVHLCESAKFDNLVLSVKSSNVPLMIEANRRLAQRCDYPLHLGVTEAGTPLRGILRSSVGIGSLLSQGIGDTIRVSLTGDPVREVEAAYDILKSLGLRQHGLTILSCPTCGRTHGNLIAIVEQIEKALSNCQKNLTLAIMGCEVNGPGEAKEADIGVACGKEVALLFKRGKIVKKIREDEILETVLKEVGSWQ